MSISELNKQCPKCGKDQWYKHQYVLNKAIRNNKVCISCCKLGSKHSEEHKRKISISVKLTYRNNPDIVRRISDKCKNKIFSQETRNKISKANKGKKRTKEYCEYFSNRQKGNIPWNKGKTGIFSKEIRDKISKVHKGKIISEETKRKHRINSCERFMKLGIGAREDNGAKIFFDKWNTLGFNFQQNWYCKGLGYWIDGYDKDKNVVLEYDTKYHNTPYQKEKDLIRQYNIIEFLKPKKFWRYNVVNKLCQNVLI